MAKNESTGINKHWLWFLIPALIAGMFVAPSTEVEVIKEIEVPVNITTEVEVEVIKEVDTTPDYLEIAKTIAMDEFEDDLDDDDLEITFDRIYDTWSVEFDKDEAGDYVVHFKARLELFNEDDYDDAEDNDEDYDAPLETYEFEVKWDESRDKYRVSYDQVRPRTSTN